MWNRVVVYPIEAIGKMAGVQSKLDTYRDFHVVAFEMLKPGKVHPDQLELLKKDPLFKDENSYLVTALQKQENGELKQRRFILNKEQAEKAGLDVAKAASNSGMLAVPPGTKITIQTHGQYLESLAGIKIAAIFPMVQSIEVTKATPEEIAALKKAMSTGKVDASLHVGYYGDAYKPTTKKQSTGLKP